MLSGRGRQKTATSVSRDEMCIRDSYISGIRIDKPSPDRVIVPAAEVVQARLGVIDVPAITQGVRGTEGGRCV